MKQNEKAFVEVPKTTLNALKSLLFGEQGTNLSAIINDLSMGQTNDLMAINVGLTFKGMKPKVDENTHYIADYRRIMKYEFVAYSLILNQIQTKAFSLKFNSDNNTFEEEWKESGVRVFTLEEWLNASTDEQNERDEVIKIYSKKA